MVETDLQWSSRPFSSLTQGERAEFRDLINEANRAYPRIFPGDRLSADGLEGGYADCEVVGLGQKGRLLGCVLLRKEGDLLWLLLLAVTPAWHGKGLGAKLIGRALAFAKDCRANSVKLQAVGESLTKFYVRHGFEVDFSEIMPPGHWGALAPFELWTLSKRV